MRSQTVHQIARALVVCFFTGCVAASQPSTPGGPSRLPEGTVLSWTRDGGFAGFCDEMTVSVDGDIRVTSCRGGAARTGRLDSAELAQLNRWRMAFATVVIENKDAAAADGMTTRVTLDGRGGGTPSPAEREAIAAWAERVFAATRG